MGLNPGPSQKMLDLQGKVLDDNFNGGSPYFGMYHCGYYGIPLEDCLDKCRRNGIPVRQKDVESWRDGDYQRSMRSIVGNRMDVLPRRAREIVASDGSVRQFGQMRLEDFPKLPEEWHGTERRFFPCTVDNRPMQKWGWSKDYSPQLYLQADAKALSPCGWVGQNMLYQKFVVFDIDGRGHGADDELVIQFGNRFRDSTFTMEDPAKPGSFHLYFETDRLIPVRHFPWAKLDLMGNAVNAAVYIKNKKSNGLKMRKLDQEIWQALLSYQDERKRTCL